MKEQSRVKISRLLFLTLNNTILKTNFICALKLSLIPLFSPYLFPHQDSSHVTATPAAFPSIAISFFFYLFNLAGGIYDDPCTKTVTTLYFS